MCHLYVVHGDGGSTLAFGAKSLVALLLSWLSFPCFAQNELNWKATKVINAPFFAGNKFHVFRFQFDEGRLIVNIIDLNDNAPEFIKPSYVFLAKREADFVVGQVAVILFVISQFSWTKRPLSFARQQRFHVMSFSHECMGNTQPEATLNVWMPGG